MYLCAVTLLKMIVEYKKDKELKAYSDFLENPQDIACKRKFKQFFSSLDKEKAITINTNLKQAKTAKMYNDIYGKDAENCIELIKNRNKKNKLFELKVSLGGSYRKFFNCMCSDTNDFLQCKNWQGQYDKIEHLHVFHITTDHDYRKKK